MAEVVGDHQICNVLSDTGIYCPTDTMYERMVIVNGWHPEDHLILGRVWLRVHRLPLASFARGSVWIPDNGWMELASANKDRFWRKAPGYERAGSPRTMIESTKLVHEVIERMQTLLAA